MEYIPIYGKQFSRIICGSNPFYGHSHFSDARSTEYLNRFSDEEIGKVIDTCIERGINTVETSANERIYRIISNKTDSNKKRLLNTISSTRIDETSKVKRHQDKLDMSIVQECSICVIHSQYLEREIKGDSIIGIEQMLETIHQKGLISGISTHSNSIIELCEKNKYPIDVYMFPLKILGFTYPGYKGNETIEDRITLINNVEKPFIIIKSMAAGRIPPSEALEFINKNMKKSDMISIGFGSAEEVNETIDIWEKITER